MGAGTSRYRGYSRNPTRGNMQTAATILLVLFVYRTATTWPGLVIVLLGVPVYFAWKSKGLGLRA